MTNPHRSRPTPPLDREPLADVLPLAQPIELDSDEIKAIEQVLAAAGQNVQLSAVDPEALPDAATLTACAEGLVALARERSAAGEHENAALSAMKALGIENLGLIRNREQGTPAQAALWRPLLALADIHEEYGDAPRAVRFLDAAFDSYQNSGAIDGSPPAGLAEPEFTERRARLLGDWSPAE